MKNNTPLGPADYEWVAEKVKRHNVPNRWCEASECMCMGCANRHLTWAEFECWRKYTPENDRIKVTD